MFSIYDWQWVDNVNFQLQILRCHTHMLSKLLFTLLSYYRLDPKVKTIYTHMRQENDKERGIKPVLFGIKINNKESSYWLIEIARHLFRLLAKQIFQI